MRPHIREYLRVLDRLSASGYLNGVVIYPACAVDALVALFADKVVCVNIRTHTAIEMIDHLRPTVGFEIAARLQDAVSRLKYLSGIDASNPDLLTQVLSRYQKTPKALLLKGVFDSLFLQEWDLDMERYYSVPHDSAVQTAKGWLARMLAWLDVGDRVICYDEKLHAALDDHELLVFREEIGSEVFTQDVAHRSGITILYCANSARIYEKRSDS